MKTLSTVAAIVVLLAFAGCATLHGEAAATLRVQCNVPDAMVLLDDGVVGQTGEIGKQGKSIRPGFYRVEIRHPSYYSYFGEIQVDEGGAAVVKAELHPLLD